MVTTTKPRLKFFLLFPAVLLLFLAAAALALRSKSIPGDDSVNSAPRTAAMFRGDVSHSGVYASPELASYGGIQWRFVADGAVRSSPTASDGVIYFGSSDGHLYAVDEQTGEERWRFDAGSPVVSTPAVAGGLVYFGARDGRLLALAKDSGKPAWTFQSGADAPLAWGHESGDFYTSSPTIAGERIYWGGGDGLLYALDGRTGKELWRFRTGGRIRSSPAVAGGMVYVGSFDGRLYAVEAESGKLRWQYETEGVKLNSGEFGYDRRSIQSSPAVWEGEVIFGARDGFLYALDARTGNFLWRFDHKISWVNSSPAVAGGMVYAASSDGRFIQCVNARTGQEVWRFKSDSLVWSSPAVTEHFVYAGDWAGNLYALDLTRGAEVWRFRTGKRILTSPVLDGGRIYFGDDGGQVFALNAGARGPLKRVVFWDTAYAKASVLTAKTVERIRDYFKENGYEVVDTRALAEFLGEGSRDHAPSVVVFSMDYLPDELARDSGDGRSLLKDYLNGGGKVVWLGIPPKMWEKDLKTGAFASMAMQRDAPRGLLGVSFERGNFDNNTARATAAGKKWGLSGWWLSNWSADPESVTQVLAEDEQGLAAAWVKSYGGAGAATAGAGFVRIPVVEGADGGPSNLSEIKNAAEYFPGSTVNK